MCAFKATSHQGRALRTGVRPAAETADSPTDAARERILAAARRHFFSLGFASCTMDCLATELGMSKKTLYQHFRSKEQIVDELMRLKSARIRDGFEALLAEPDVAFSERTARMTRHALVEVGEISAIFLHDLRRFMPAAYARLEEFRARVAPGIWERLLRSGVEAGAVRADVDPVFIGRLIPVVVQALLDPETLQRFEMQPHEMIQRFFNLMFSGVLTSQGMAEHELIITNRIPPAAPR